MLPMEFTSNFNLTFVVLKDIFYGLRLINTVTSKAYSFQYYKKLALVNF